jgi:serine/threonine protein kinase
MLERPVAIKVLPPDQAAHESARERFLRELRILGRVRHPNLAQVYGSGEAAGGLYYAMEFIEGSSLQVQWERMRETGLEALRGRTWLTQPVEWLRQAASAAHALHDAGFVHRNLTPHNILVTADSRRAVLVGLGIAKEGINEGGLTRPGSFVGTPAYMSPEQARGVERIDGRADVYALGVLLWEMLTLRRLVEGPPGMEVLWHVQNVEPETVTKYNRHAPRDLVAVCEKCLRKHPDQRYQSADVLAEDLGRFLAGRAVTARPRSTLERLLGWVSGPWRATADVVAEPVFVPRPSQPPEPPPRAEVPATGEAEHAQASVPPAGEPATGGPSPRAHSRGEEVSQSPTSAPDPVFSSQMVVTLYPAPIAFAYRRFYQETEPRLRLDALFCVMEASVRYLLALGLSDLFRSLARSDRTGAALPDNPSFDFLRRRRPVSLGTWVDALIETARALEGETPVIKELPELCRPGGSFVENLLRPLVRWRNDCAHPDGSIRVSSEECKGVLRDYRPRLDEALREARFVCRYPLGFVSPFTNMPAGSGQRYYHLHACMGAWVRETSRAMDVKTDLELRPDLPFVVTPDGGKLLYVWPLLLQRRSAYTGRRTLWAFEEIPEDKGRFLTRVRWSAIDGREDHSDKLQPEPAANHTWLFQRLRELPPAVEAPPALQLAEKLFPTRGGKLVGQEVGSNRLLAAVAIGGFGTIYAAEATDGARVAVKVVESRLTDTQLARFRQEFDKLRLAAEHPGVVRCFEYGDVYVDGRVCPWYSMEFALGGDLRARIDKRKALLKGNVPWLDMEAQQAVCREFLEVTAAVAHLHRLGFVHRDLKPGNVLIMEDGKLRLSDFGLIKNLQASEETLLHGPHTTTGGGAGTPGYMPPEQARGLDVDQRADVYSLGILLAELVLGGRPQADLLGEPGQAERGSTLRRCVSLRNLPRGLRALIERCTDADPECRPADAFAVLEQFQALTKTADSN